MWLQLGLFLALFLLTGPPGHPEQILLTRAETHGQALPPNQRLHVHCAGYRVISLDYSHRQAPHRGGVHSILSGDKIQVHTAERVFRRHAEFGTIVPLSTAIKLSMETWFSGLLDSSSRKGACRQVRRAEFDPWGPHGGRREPTLKCCPQVICMHPPPHTHTKKEKKYNFLKKVS